MWKYLNQKSGLAGKPGNESLICGSKTVALNRLEVGTPYDQIMKIPYTGGNGAAYSATAPDDLGNGLSIERLAGTLAYGQGEVGTTNVSQFSGAGRSLYNYAVQTILSPNVWTNLSGSSDTGPTAYAAYNLNPNNRDVGEAIIVLQHNTIKDVYRLTFNIYGAISATGTTAAVDGTCTIFIEKLD